MATYLLTIRTMIPVYDIHTRIIQDIYQDITKEEMINIGKKRFFDQVNECFYNGVKQCTGLNFDFEKIETYHKEDYHCFWETCDTRVTFTSPNGPAILEIYEIIKEEDEIKKNDNQLPLNKILIYSLPKIK